jgi:hypothetical protein
MILQESDQKEDVNGSTKEHGSITLDAFGLHLNSYRQKRARDFFTFVKKRIQFEKSAHCCTACALCFVYKSVPGSRLAFVSILRDSLGVGQITLDATFRKVEKVIPSLERAATLMD